MAWIKKFWTLDKPDSDEEFKRKYWGRSFRVKDENGQYVVVEAESIQGSLVHPTKFQINSKGNSYLISMLDFFAQANGEKVTEKDCDEFEAAFQGAYVRKNPILLKPKRY